MRKFKNQFLTFVILTMVMFAFNNTTYAQRYWNTAAKFDGTSNSYVAVKPWSPLANLSGSFTIGCWFYSEPGGTGVLVGKDGIRLMLSSTPDGKVKGRLQTNGNTKFYSRVRGMERNRWYHLMCTYDSTGSGFMRFYINGGFDTARAGTNLGPDPDPVTDSVYIGTGFGNFKGMVDDVRIWDRPLSGLEIAKTYRSTFVGALLYNSSKMVMSCNFEFTYTGPPSSSLYFYDGYNNYKNNNAAAVNLGKNPGLTVAPNSSLELNGTNSYARGTSNPDIEVTGPATVEAWIYPHDPASGSIQYIVRKGSDYLIYLDATGKIRYGFTAVGISTITVPANQWTHIAATCSPAGIVKLYINGQFNASGNAGTPPTPGTDTLLIGKSTGSSGYFDGLIDAVKISNYEKKQEEVTSEMLRIIDNSSQPQPPRTTVSYNFDYYTGSSTGEGPLLSFRGSANFSYPHTVANTPVSPLAGGNVLSFPEGYFLTAADNRIPVGAATAGFMEEDSLVVTSGSSITDLNLFIAINHERNYDLQITLVAPTGDSAIIWDRDYGYTTSGEHIVTVFDDDADSTLASGYGHFIDFGPSVKPRESLNSSFSGINPQGTWILRITDFTNGNTGMLHGWGVQVNNTVGITQNTTTGIPDGYALSQNYPNPFNPVTNINFSILQKGFVKLRVFDITGREVAVLANGEFNPGAYTVDFDGSMLSSGVYFYKLETGSFVNTKKMILLK